MGSLDGSLSINPAYGWSESFAFWLGSVGNPDDRVGDCEADAYLTDGESRSPVAAFTDGNLVTTTVPRGAPLLAGPFTLVVRVIDPALPTDRYVLEATANVGSALA